MAVWIVRILGSLSIVGTLLPLLPTGFWLVRGWDFPRFQLAVQFLILISLAIFCHGKFTNRREFASWLTVLTVAFVWQASHVVQFTPLWPKEIRSSNVEQPAFRLLVVNLDYENSAHEAVDAEIREIDPDILILIEVDERWREGLSGLRSSFEFHHEEVRGAGLGIALWSVLPLQSTETRFLVEERRPSIWAEIAHQETTINLVAVHPTPPGLRDSTGESRRNSRVRDAELVMIAKEIADRQTEAWIVAGDFNDVAWSHTTRLFKRLSGLRDPRIGRNLIGTYHADYPVVRFPIDHVFLSDGFSVSELARHHMTGSDHFGVSAAIAIATPSAGVTPEPKGDDRSEAEEIVDEGEKDAKQREVSSAP